MALKLQRVVLVVYVDVQLLLLTIMLVNVSMEQGQHVPQMLTAQQLCNSFVIQQLIRLLQFVRLVLVVIALLMQIAPFLINNAKMEPVLLLLTLLLVLHVNAQMEM
jgi:hypothetical protein